MIGGALPLPVRIADIWVYLAASPLLWLTATLLAYLAADVLAGLLGRHPLANPVLMATGALILVLLATNTDYAAYFAGAQFVHFLLGPATVALAVPLYRNRARVRASLLPIGLALIAGSFTAIVSAMACAAALGAPWPVILSLAPKSTTAPIAMSLAETIGGIPTLTAVLVVATGICGAVLVTPLMNRLGLKDYAARGFAVGLASHGIGTARAFQVDSLAGAFAGVAMGLNGALTALILPPVVALVGIFLK